jgi:hypothetical protein
MEPQHAPRFRSSSLVPAGFAVDHLGRDADRVGLVVRSGAAVATCPDCGTPSRRLQSRYRRRAADLPLGGRRVELRVVYDAFGGAQLPGGGRSSPSAFPMTSCPPSRDAPRGWSRSSITSGSHSVVGPVRASPSASGCPSVATRSCASSAVGRPHGPIHSASSASTTSPGDAITATAPWSAISNAAASSRSCQTASRPPHRLG